MKKFWTLALTACLFIAVLFVLPVNAQAAEIVDSGTCGDNLTWSLNNGGTLTISGTAARSPILPGM